MSKVKNLSSTMLILLFLISFAGCKTIMDKIFTNEPQPISGAIDIDREWKEITPPAPLKSTVSIQHVSLKMAEEVWRNADWDENDKDRQTLKYGDGQTGRIEATLFDDQGNSYELWIGGKGGGFDLSRKTAPRQPGEPPKTEPDFPTDRVYTKLRIRSDVPLHLDKIEWTGYDPK